MKTAIYLSGILGMILIVIGFLGKMMGFTPGNIFLITGSVFLLLVFIPLIIIERNQYNKRIDQIIESYRNNPEKKKEAKSEKKTTTGWGMNNSPFRERTSGLSWGGGNIKAANAKRGSRRSFLK